MSQLNISNVNTQIGASSGVSSNVNTQISAPTTSSIISDINTQIGAPVTSNVNTPVNTETDSTMIIPINLSFKPQVNTPIKASVIIGISECETGLQVSWKKLENFETNDVTNISQEENKEITSTPTSEVGNIATKRTPYSPPKKYKIPKLSDNNCTRDYGDNALENLVLGADPNTTFGGEKNKSALQLSIIHGSIKNLKSLINFGANVNYQDKDGYTAVFIALRFNAESMLKYLIESGADVNIPNYAGVTPLMYAVAMLGVYQQKIITMLIDAGADIFAQDTQGRDAFFYAKNGFYPKNAELLKIKENAK